mmetsp:Transcript_36711/g.65674  ORF Transcript_36711/g.65674 Transcript_36711/m.65674 type:complete len:117 (-) Transcript_36711:804-1154(-)
MLLHVLYIVACRTRSSSLSSCLTLPAIGGSINTPAKQKLRQQNYVAWCCDGQTVLKLGYTNSCHINPTFPPASMSILGVCSSTPPDRCPSSTRGSGRIPQQANFEAEFIGGTAAIR